eukprot:TRINITY_DN11375_c0_g1_i1.p1 TRINITY_DN11375_c0_g1~~TRINITY_DN11375_c0_g1_i1.p1  ORF type:complete len:442 (+),score=62.27 TRINITY_DN11375_c0_g1_i1:158-1483(+)
MTSAYAPLAQQGSEPPGGGDSSREATLKDAGGDSGVERRLVGQMIVALRAQHKGSVGVEEGSVYGAAVLMPQVARTCGWPEELLSLTISSYVYLILCLVVHGGILVYMQKSDRVSDGFGGQMYLCDFGANVDNCRDGDPSCVGPGGTTMSPPRMYGWGQWVTRVYVRDAMMSVFPDHKDTIGESVDPGEYGLESYNCRLLCVFVFLMSVIEELYLIVRMIRFFMQTPSENQPWVTFKEGQENGAAGVDVNASLDNVEVRVAGMSVWWKVFSVLTVLVPKAVLWTLTVDTGVSFLMETAGIDDIIVNSVALTFLLTMDETIVEGLMSAQTKYLLEKCQDYELEGIPMGDPDEEVREAPLYVRLPKALGNVVGYSCFKLLLTTFLSAVFLVHYYHRHCTYVDGRWVSKTVYTPHSTAYNFFNAVLPWAFPIEQSEKPYWTMPQ